MVDLTPLLFLSASAAFLHTLIPDHELPLAMIGRANRWGIKKMSLFTLVAGVLHISISMGIGVIALVATTALAGTISNLAHLLSGAILIGFGAVYAFLGWKKKGHGHTHGSKYAAHPHGRAPPGSGIEIDAQGKPVFHWTTWFAAIGGMAPCVTLIPVLFTAVWYPPESNAVLLTMLVFAVSTILTMLFTANLALKAITYITRMQKIEKWIEVIAGVVILAVGVYMIGGILFPQFIPHIHPAPPGL